MTDIDWGLTFSVIMMMVAIILTALAVVSFTIATRISELKRDPAEFTPQGTEGQVETEKRVRTRESDPDKRARIRGTRISRKNF